MFLSTGDTFAEIRNIFPIYRTGDHFPWLFCEGKRNTDKHQYSIFQLDLVTLFGLQALGGWGVPREVLGSDTFNLWKPLVSPGVEGTWAPVRETGRMAWYFNDNYPWLEIAALCWILAGGAHHTGFSQAQSVEHIRDFTEIAGVKLLVVGEFTNVTGFIDNIHLNDVYYH